MALAMNAGGQHEKNEHTSAPPPSPGWSIPEVRLYRDDSGHIRIADDPDTYGSYSLKRMATSLEADPSLARGLNRNCQAGVGLVYEDEVGRRVRIPIAGFNCVHDGDGFYITSAVNPSGENIKELQVAKRSLSEPEMDHDPDDPSRLEALFAQALNEIEGSEEELSMPQLRDNKIDANESAPAAESQLPEAAEDRNRTAPLIIGGSPVLQEEARAVWYAVGTEGWNQRRIEAEKNGQRIMGKLWTDMMIDHVREREASPAAQPMVLVALIGAKARTVNTQEMKLREYVRNFLEQAVDTPEQYLENPKDRVHLQTIAMRLLGPRETPPDEKNKLLAVVSGAKQLTAAQLTQRLQEARHGDVKRYLLEVNGVAASAFNSLKGAKRDASLQEELKNLSMLAAIAKDRLSDVPLSRTDRERLRNQIGHVASRAAKRLNEEGPQSTRAKNNS